MADHLSDEEQLEALKRWWNESGRQTLAMIIIAVLGYFGWNAWQDHQQQQAEIASELYQQMMDVAQVEPGTTFNDEQSAAITHLAVSLQTEHAGSQYAHYASLMLAKLAVEKDDLDTAASELQSVMDDASEGVALIARLRLAKVEAAREKFDAAIALLDGVDAKTLTSAYAEARGDFYFLQGKNELAHTAYQQALETMSTDNNRTKPLLELKINQVQPRDAGPETEESTEGDA